MDDHKTTYLHLAASRQNPRICKLVIDYGHNLKIDSKNHFEATPLHYAAIYNSKACIPLLQFGADINSTTKEGFTPLQEAVTHGNYKVFQLLCKNERIDINWQNAKKDTALHQAVTCRVPRYADPNDPYKPYVSDDDYTLMLIELLQKGANANIQDESGNTALHIASSYEMDYITRKLLHYNTDIHIRNNADETAIQLAEKNEYGHVRNLLWDNERNSKRK